MNCKFNSDSKRWVACKPEEARIKIPFTPDFAPGTFINPRHVLERRASAVRAVIAHQRRGAK